MYIYQNPDYEKLNKLIKKNVEELKNHPNLKKYYIQIMKNY